MLRHGTVVSFLSHQRYFEYWDSLVKIWPLPIFPNRLTAKLCVRIWNILHQVSSVLTNWTLWLKAGHKRAILEKHRWLIRERTCKIIGSAHERSATLLGSCYPSQLELSGFGVGATYHDGQCKEPETEIGSSPKTWFKRSRSSVFCWDQHFCISYHTTAHFERGSLLIHFPIGKEHSRRSVQVRIEGHGEYHSVCSEYSRVY